MILYFRREGGKKGGNGPAQPGSEGGKDARCLNFGRKGGALLNWKKRQGREGRKKVGTRLL